MRKTAEPCHRMCLNYSIWNMSDALWYSPEGLGENLPNGQVVALCQVPWETSHNWTSYASSYVMQLNFMRTLSSHCCSQTVEIQHDASIFRLVYVVCVLVYVTRIALGTVRVWGCATHSPFTFRRNCPTACIWEWWDWDLYFVGV